jgi:hypothetical protein
MPRWNPAESEQVSDLIVRRGRQDEVRQGDGHAATLQAHDVRHRPHASTTRGERRPR